VLLVIDLRNDYLPEGKVPLWNTDTTLQNIEEAIAAARTVGVPVIHIQHIADPAAGPASFFNAGSWSGSRRSAPKLIFGC
jgi:nicotinamidase-related amidase